MRRQAPGGAPPSPLPSRAPASYRHLPNPTHLHLRDAHLALRQPFTPAHGTLTSQHNLIVILSDGHHHGLGESPFSHAWQEVFHKILRKQEAFPRVQVVTY